MDIDNGGQEAPTGAFDIEQSLLQQFSCMGTTDKDELIMQLQLLVGPNVNYNTAAFFLEMNNWNLQEAICSFFDVDKPNKLPSVSLHSNNGYNDNEKLIPNQHFEKSWYVRNSGTEAWPAGCYVQCAGGDNFGAEKYVLPALDPDFYAFITIRMTSPNTPGTYHSKWRFCTTSGCYFGDILWTIITVVDEEEEGTMQLTDQLSHLSDLGAPVPLHSGNSRGVTEPPEQMLAIAINPFGTVQTARGSENVTTNNSTSTDLDSNMS